ncbi:MAG TPA: MFS transporter [Candidatus Limnocylindrales bacterium]|nr:MFS transporter [Candidatus Limnocylindrales bacterium]
MAEVGAVAANAPAVAPVSAWTDEDAPRPTERLPFLQLLQISIYWLGINSIMGGIGVAMQERVPGMVPLGEKGTFLALQGWLLLVVNIAVQPTIGMISDYTQTRWGRRKPYIAIGAVLDVVFITGVALSNTFLAVTAFLFLFQFSSNFAQGPFQGYVPDLVPEEQVSLASAMVGAMQTVGYIVGGVIIATAYILHDPADFTIPTIALGLVELATALGTVRWVREGGAPRDRRGRSWFEIAKSAWATDILREHSFVFLVLSRLMFFAGINALLGWYVVGMFNQTFRLTDADKAIMLPVTQVVVALITVASTFPSARLSDRIGRKPVIYVACVIGAIGLEVVAAAPGFAVFLLGAAAMGAAAGTFLAVDWALMTDIIPKAASGRYMGISNIAVAASGALANALVGPLIDIVGGKAELPEGPRVATAAAVIFFILAAAFLHWVDPRKREARLAAEAAATAAAA